MEVPSQEANVELEDVAMNLPVHVLPVPVVKPSSLAGRWLLLVQSDSDMNVPLASREQLESSGFDLNLSRVYSSQLNGLEPCEYVTVAQSYIHREEARYWARQLERLGVASSVQYAGSIAPLDGELEERCQRELDEVSRVCPEEFRWLTTAGTTTWMELDPAPQVENLETWGDLGIHDQVAWWRADVPEGVDVSGVAVGDSWRAYGADGEVQTCRITGFDLLARGVPHHDRESTNETLPTCGEAVLYARTDCKGAPVWAQPASRSTPDRYRALPDERVSPTVLAQTMVRLTDSLGYRLARSRGEAQAREERQLLQESSEVQVWERQDGQRVLLVRSTLKTQDGMRTCDERVVNAVVVGIVGMDGQVLSEFREGRGAVLDVVDFDEGGRLSVVQEVWPREQWLFNGRGEARCRAKLGYCDSPCGEVSK